jgi:hypothetical protein
MGNNIRTGSKTPKTKDRMLASAQLPPLPKMYQMGIAKGVEQERERIINLLRQTIGYSEQFDYETEIVKIIAAIEGESNGNV